MPYSDYQLDKMGSAKLATNGPFEVASFGTLTIVYTVGSFGLDDLGSIRIAWRNCSDMALPQFSNPDAPNFTTAEASNGAVLKCSFERAVRPFPKALTVTATSGYLSPGDTITVRLGDTRQGSPGIRLQSAVETGSEIAVMVDPFSTRDYAMLPDRLTFSVSAAAPVVWRAVLPTMRRVGEPFRLCLRADDAYGNPTDKAQARFRLAASSPVGNLPSHGELRHGQFQFVAENLVVDKAGDVTIEMIDDTGKVLAVSNPLRIVAEAEAVPYWCDFHWQSRETVGVGTIRDGFAFARDKAFIDVTSHAANDLQLSNNEWRNLNEAFKEYDETGRFVVLPGYEWSGNTPLGGDRNVIYRNEGGTLRRSSHALVPDRADIGTDCTDARKLFEALKASGEQVLTFAHVGGRHCNIKFAHDAAVETAIEVHSTYWGTFEWLIRDAIEMGYRVGFVCNSDDHKGRPGASCVGFAEWGNGGGLTCVLADELSRDGVWKALKQRHHYGTTGIRLLLDTQVMLGKGATIEGSPPRRLQARTIMGDVVRASEDTAEFTVDVLSPVPVQRVEIRNGLEIVKILHPHSETEAGDRIHVTFEGAEFRGRMPATKWDGVAEFSNARILDARPLNFALKQKSLKQDSDRALSWSNITTGNVVGFDVRLANSKAGTMRIETPQGIEQVLLKDVGRDEIVFDYGKLGRRMRISRLPDTNGHHAVKETLRIPLRKGDNPLYAMVTLEDCNQAWASPIYVVR